MCMHNWEIKYVYLEIKYVYLEFCKLGIGKLGIRNLGTRILGTRNLGIRMVIQWGCSPQLGLQPSAICRYPRTRCGLNCRSRAIVVFVILLVFYILFCFLHIFLFFTFLPPVITFFLEHRIKRRGTNQPWLQAGGCNHHVNINGMQSTPKYVGAHFAACVGCCCCRYSCKRRSAEHILLRVSLA